MARPSKLTPEITAEFERILSAVPYWETAADYLGLHPSTVWRWLRRGEREPDGPYGTFCKVVKKARAGLEITLAGRVRTEPEAWQRYAWMLERAYPEHWGKRVDITLRKEAERLAVEYGLDADALIAEAERIVTEAHA